MFWRSSKCSYPKTKKDETTSSTPTESKIVYISGHNDREIFNNINSWSRENDECEIISVNRGVDGAFLSVQCIPYEYIYPAHYYS